MGAFAQRDIQRAFRKFSDLADDLERADHASWHTCLSLLIHHCRTDPVMRVVVDPLRANTDVDVDEWFNASMEAQTYRLPTDDDQRLALFYQIFERINDERFNLLGFTFHVLGVVGGSFDDEFRAINEHFVSKFARDVGYRLDECLQDTQDEEYVPEERITSIFIAGDVVGSAVGTGTSLIANNITAFKGSLSQLDPELKEAFVKAMEAADAEVLADTDRRDLLDEMSKLVEALKEPSPEAGRIRRYWNHVKDIAPPVAAILASVKAIAEFL